MSIFNSLGSNYNLQFVLKALFASSKESFRLDLVRFLEKKYDGQAVLVYKGREAIEMALKTADLPPKTAVAINGFTCWAVYKSIINAGFNVHYLDIDPQTLNFSPETLEKNLKTNPEIRAVIIQNTLGYPCQIEKIAQICKEKKIALIEDLAHSVGVKYSTGRQAGTVGDLVVFSFSQDKMIDGISGGALIVRNKKYRKNVEVELRSFGVRQQLLDRFYPLFTYKIRKTYSFGLGKVIHFFLKSVNLLSKPVIPNFKNLHRLSNWYCLLIKNSFENLNKDLTHRRKIASTYADKIDSKITSKEINKQIPLSSCLRFPIFVKKRSDLIGYLNKKNVYVSDIWYDAPVSPVRFLLETSYQNQCPNAEKLSQEILNLPTHKNVSEKDAECIAEEVNQWLKSQ